MEGADNLLDLGYIYFFRGIFELDRSKNAMSVIHGIFDLDQSDIAISFHVEGAHNLLNSDGTSSLSIRFGWHF